MIKDYKLKSVVRPKVNWEGWVLSARLNFKGEVLRLYDQDYIHNGKFFINPLDSPVRALQLGPETCFLEHIGLVYNTFTVDEHGLTLEDIHRTDC